MASPFLGLKPIEPIPRLFLYFPTFTPIPSLLPRISSQRAPRPPPPEALALSCRRDGKLQEAISALEQGSPIRSDAYISLLQTCIDSDSIEDGRRIHASLASVQDPNPFVETKLVGMYAKCGSLEDARKVFDGMLERNLFSWSAMIGGCTRERRWAEVIGLFYRMMKEGIAPDQLILTRILQACSNAGDLETGKLLHSVALRTGILGLSEESHVSNSLLAMYVKCGKLEMATRYFKKLATRDRVAWNSIISGYCQCGDHEEALMLFEQMRADAIEPGLVTWNILITSYTQSGNPERALKIMKQMDCYRIKPDVYTWTSMISGFAQNNLMNDALNFFTEMQLSGVKPNGMSVACAVSSCASLQAVNKGKELHAYAVKTGSAHSVLVGNSLIDMYTKCDRLDEAEKIFEEMLEKDVFTWNSMIAGYTRSGYCGKAYDLFSRMENSGVHRNAITWNTMVSGYIQNGDEDQAMELFHIMELEGVQRDTATWNTLIAGHVQNGNADKALAIFRQMQSALFKPNSVSILSILPACANLISSWKVKEIHSWVLHNNLQCDTSIANSLIDTYSKSGDIKQAEEVFNALKIRDLISWNSMIAGFVLHGYSHSARDLFNKMVQAGERPNRATLASLISSYGLEGMVNEGKKLISSMTVDYNLSPGLEHYVEMINLLGRSCQITEASDLIEEMPVEPDSSIWKALLLAANFCSNMSLANHAAENLFKLEPRNSEVYRLLLHTRSLYTNSGDVPIAKKAKKEFMVNQTHGCCWVEVKHKVHKFPTGMQLAPNMESKYQEIFRRLNDAKEIVCNFGNAFLDADEENEDTAGIHSEKLAVAYALIDLPPYRSIRIIKSLKICTKCHSNLKLVSKVYQREILIGDSKCLHCFKDGKCSCRDYW